MFNLTEYTKEEYKADMQRLLAEKGLHDAVEVYCDKINEVAGVLSYVPHRDIQEFLCDILYLIDLDKEQKALKAWDDLYKKIYDHHYEIIHMEESEAKRAKLSLSNWILDTMTEYDF